MESRELFQKSADSMALERGLDGLDKSSGQGEIKQGPASQGGGNFLANSFRSAEGFGRISSSGDDFERASEENDSNMNANNNAAEVQEQIKPILATPENTQCYNLFESHPVRVEGPEFNRDFTYYLVHKMPDLKNFEHGIANELVMVLSLR